MMSFANPVAFSSLREGLPSVVVEGARGVNDQVNDVHAVRLEHSAWSAELSGVERESDSEAHQVQ